MGPIISAGGGDGGPYDKQEASDAPEGTPVERRALDLARHPAPKRRREESRTHVAASIWGLTCIQCNQSLHRDTHEALQTHVMSGVKGMRCLAKKAHGAQRGAGCVR